MVNAMVTRFAVQLIHLLVQRSNGTNYISVSSKHRSDLPDNRVGSCDVSLV